MEPFDLHRLGIEAGSGALAGALVGFAVKKVAKLVAVLVGLELALAKFLESRDVLSVDWAALTGAADAGAAVAETPPTWMTTLLSTLSISAGFTGGFLLGFRRG